MADIVEVLVDVASDLSRARAFVFDARFEIIQLRQENADLKRQIEELKAGQKNAPGSSVVENELRHRIETAQKILNGYANSKSDDPDYLAESNPAVLTPTKCQQRQ